MSSVAAMAAKGPLNFQPIRLSTKMKFGAGMIWREKIGKLAIADP